MSPVPRGAAASARRPTLLAIHPRASTELIFVAWREGRDDARVPPAIGCHPLPTRILCRQLDIGDLVAWPTRDSSKPLVYGTDPVICGPDVPCPRRRPDMAAIRRAGYDEAMIPILDNKDP